jgi:hypothetical protein
MVSKILQYQTEMFFVFFFALGVNQYTIDEHSDELVQIFQKGIADQIHKVGRSIS